MGLLGGPREGDMGPHFKLEGCVMRLQLAIEER